MGEEYEDKKVKPNLQDCKSEFAVKKDFLI
jgi:hypothetical protein